MTPLQRALAFWACSLVFFLPLHPPYYPCPGAVSIEPELERTWKLAKKLNEEEKKREALQLCRRIDSLARHCPTRYAGYLVAANAMASTLTVPYEARLQYILSGEEALARYEPFVTDDFFLRANILIQYEHCRYDDSMGELENAINCYEAVWGQLPDEHPDSILGDFQNALPYSISWLYERTGDYKKALDWLGVMEKHLDTTHHIYPGVFYNLRGRINQLLNDYEEAEADYQRSIEAFGRNSLGRATNHYIENYIDLANLHLIRSAPTAALTVLGEASEQGADRPYSKLYLHYQLANTFLALDSLRQALWHGRQALDVVRKIVPGPYYWTGRVMGTIGETLARQRRWPEALDTIQVALTHLSRHPPDGQWNKNPEPRHSDTKLDLLKMLVLKANTLKSYYRSAEPSPLHLLQWSLETSLQAIELIKILRAEYYDDEVKEYLSQRSFPIFENALAAAFRLYDLTEEPPYLDAAFAIMETSKALSLLENLKDLEAREFANLPPELIRRETQLKYKIATLERQFSDEKNPQKKHALEDELFRSKVEYQILIDRFRQEHKEYYNLKYETTPVKIDRLRESLDADETLVEYFFGDRNAYAFAIARSGVRRTSFPVTDTFTRSLDEFLDLSGNPRKMTTFTDLARFQQTGNRLFRQLIAPLKVRTQKMIVIPDGPLHYLPFAALPTAIADVETTRALPYLIRQHVISRNFSASVLFQHQTIDAGKSRSLKPLLIVSPAAFPNDSRLSLDPAGLAAEFGDQARIERDVTKETFRRLLREGYENIFLFTHASASGDDPFLLLFEDTLFLRELYATPVASNLVLLGACETGLGQNRRGEGVLSLAHGFAYQNVPKTLMTLWKVQDSAALRISLDFLRLHLLEQKPMAEALRQAKLNYIADPKGDGRPFMWAGFVGVGRE